MLKMFKTIEKTIGLFLKAKTLFDVFGDEYSFFFVFFGIYVKFAVMDLNVHMGHINMPSVIVFR